MDGDRVGDIAGFRIESEIGRGGMGVVYLAHQEFPERRVALKLLAPDLASDPAFRERFIRESNAAASTEHPHIVPIYGAGESGGHLYLAMRYIEGTDLGTLLAREGSLSPDRASRICAEIADALEAAHDRGLIHRDVKPGNILLDGRDHAYLTDFGLIRRTKLHTDLTRTGQFMGTIDYVAPEQIKGGEIDGRVDVYSLGCVLYECLAGAPPFRRDSEVATMYAHLEDPPPRPSSKRPGMSPGLAATVQKAIAKQPEERFATPGEMADALRDSVVPIRGRGGGRRVTLVVGLATVLLVAVVAFAMRSGDEGSPTTVPSPSTPAVALDSLVQIDAETGRVSSTTPIPALLDQRPRVEIGEGGVWVLAGSEVLHVDPDGAIVGSIPTGAGSFSSLSLAVGFRTVWVGSPPGVLRIDPSDDQPLRSVRLEGGDVVGSGPSVGIGESNAWAVTGNGELTRIAPYTGVKGGSADVGASASAIAVGFDSVWVVDDLQRTLIRVDATTLDVQEVLPIAGEIDGIAVGAGAVWILDSSAGVVTPIDPISGSTGLPIRVGLHPTDVTTGLGAVWVANQGEGTISRIDPITEAVETIDVGGPVSAIAVDERNHTIWGVVAEAFRLTGSP